MHQAPRPELPMTLKTPRPKYEATQVPLPCISTDQPHRFRDSLSGAQARPAFHKLCKMHVGHSHLHSVRNKFSIRITVAAPAFAFGLAAAALAFAFASAFFAFTPLMLP